MCSVPKAHQVKAQGNALGECETNFPSPNGAKGSCLSLRPNSLLFEKPDKLEAYPTLKTSDSTGFYVLDV